MKVKKFEAGQVGQVVWFAYSGWRYRYEPCEQNTVIRVSPGGQSVTIEGASGKRVLRHTEFDCLLDQQEAAQREAGREAGLANVAADEEYARALSGLKDAVLRVAGRGEKDPARPARLLALVAKIDNLTAEINANR